MSSATNQRHKSSSQYPTYLPIPTTTATASMDNPAMTRSTHSATESLDDPDRTGAGTLPSTYSSQQLMPSSASDSMEDIEKAPQITVPERSSATRSEWITVIVLCFINLINYMDRFTIAGVLADVQEDFKLGDDYGGLLQTVFVVAYMIFAPFFGYLGDRYSRRLIMAIGILLWSGTTLMGSFMHNFGWFLAFRGFVGIGEASYSTIAPTIISDMFVNKLRSKMLAAFYFAIPVGSGIGYIVGTETAHIANDWRYALRVTPFLGFMAVVCILFTTDPVRGESEGGAHNLEVTTYKEDLQYLFKTPSFVLSTLGFTCVAFVTGALSWWAPKFILLGFKMQEGNENVTQNDVSYKVGMVTLVAGIVGVALGSTLATRLRATIANCDPYICAVGLLLSAPMVYFALILPKSGTIWTFIFMFGAQVTVNMSWPIVADMLLYVIVPTRRSTAEAVQILVMHTFGDAGSPYLIGVISEAIKNVLRKTTDATADMLSGDGLRSLSLTLIESLNSTTSATATAAMLQTATTELPSTAMVPITSMLLEQRKWTTDTDAVKFRALQYALFVTCFVEVLGGVFFMLNSVYIVRDRMKAEQATRRGY